LVGSSARVTSVQTDFLTVALPSKKAPQITKAKKTKVSETKPDNKSASLNLSQASARLQIKSNGKGKQESWTVKTTTKPSTKRSRQTSFRVRLSDVGFRVCLVYYDDEATRREPYLCYLSAKEWQQAKRGSLANFAQIVADKLTERAAKADADREKLGELLQRVKTFS
jgi:regulator of replication initiation timing